jgi:hypothetical protein
MKSSHNHVKLGYKFIQNTSLDIGLAINLYDCVNRDELTNDEIENGMNISANKIQEIYMKKANKIINKLSYHNPIPEIKIENDLLTIEHFVNLIVYLWNNSEDEESKLVDFINKLEEYGLDFPNISFNNTDNTYYLKENNDELCLFIKNLTNEQKREINELFYIAIL